MSAIVILVAFWDRVDFYNVRPDLGNDNPCFHDVEMDVQIGSRSHCWQRRQFFRRAAFESVSI